MDQVLEALQAARLVKVGICDLDGVLRGKYVEAKKCIEALRGDLGFCSVVLGWDVGDRVYPDGGGAGYPDARVRLDARSLRLVPWEENTPLMLADFCEADGTPLPICPRQLLKRQVAEATRLGFSCCFGAEFEWFNFRETPQSAHAKQFAQMQPLSAGMFGYSLLRAGQSAPFLHALFNTLQAMRVPLESLHTETGPGVLEASISASDALEAADRAAVFKSVVKDVAHAHGIMASFMAKVFDDLPGCGGHVHQSLLRDGRNAFFDAQATDQMSPTLRHYLAGQLMLATEMLPLFAPNVNSYKRYVPHVWAPTHATWGTDNRFAALRVVGKGASMRVETRLGGSDANAYLAMAAALGSGLYGVRHKLPLQADPAQTRGDAAQALPKNLHAATERLARSEACQEIFGEAFVRHFCASRRWEWQQYERSVSSWERARYFEII